LQLLTSFLLGGRLLGGGLLGSLFGSLLLGSRLLGSQVGDLGRSGTTLDTVGLASVEVIAVGVNLRVQLVKGAQTNTVGLG